VETTIATAPQKPSAAERANPEDRLGLLDAALEYIETRHWDVVLGTSVQRESGLWSCSCGDPRCAQIGAHPAMRDWQKKTSGQPSRAHEWWGVHPQASIILPTGRAFDVLECSEQAGLLALARLERSGSNPGPVAATPTRRLYFFVLPNSRTKVAKALAGLGWGLHRGPAVADGHPRPGAVGTRARGLCALATGSGGGAGAAGLRLRTAQGQDLSRDV
jgi:hypothetical protein